MMRTCFVLLITVCFVAACSSDDLDMRQGVIEYSITYLDDPKEKPLVSFLPTKAHVFFKNDNTLTQIEGLLSVFMLNYLALKDEPSNYTLLRLVDKKYMYISPPNGKAFGYKEMGDLKVRFVNETKEIAGVMCSKAIATSEKMNYVPLVLYYTYEIDIKNPNATTPFQQIDGVLMEFQLQLEGINMKFKARQIIQQEVDDKLFVLPEGHKLVNYKEMHEQISIFNEDP